jgi:hypothetical protein
MQLCSPNMCWFVHALLLSLKNGNHGARCPPGRAQWPPSKLRGKIIVGLAILFFVSRRRPPTLRSEVNASDIVAPQSHIFYIFSIVFVKPAHNTTKILCPNLQWGCQSHWFAKNKGLNVSCGKNIYLQ